LAGEKVLEHGQLGEVQSGMERAHFCQKVEDRTSVDNERHSRSLALDTSVAAHAYIAAHRSSDQSMAPSHACLAAHEEASLAHTQLYAFAFRTGHRVEYSVDAGYVLL
jgi:hypothetical protein